MARKTRRKGGWYGEPGRHALAAKGIKTGRKGHAKYKDVATAKKLWSQKEISFIAEQWPALYAEHKYAEVVKTAGKLRRLLKHEGFDVSRVEEKEDPLRRRAIFVAFAMSSTEKFSWKDLWEDWDISIVRVVAEEGQEAWSQGISMQEDALPIMEKALPPDASRTEIEQLALVLGWVKFPYLPSLETLRDGYLSLERRKQHRKKLRKLLSV